MSDNTAIFKYAIQPGSQLAMHVLRKKTFQKIGELTCEFAYADEPIFYSDKETVSFRPLKTGEKWNEKLFGCGLMHFTGKVPECAKGKHVVLLVDVGGEACVLTKEGKIIAGITDIAPIEKNFHILRGKKIIDVSPCAKGNEDVDLWMETGDNDLGVEGNGILRQADICIWREDVGGLFYDVQNLALTKPYHPFYTQKHLSINRSLFRSYRALFSTSEKSVEKARKIISAERKRGEKSPYTVYAVGHGHLDLAFMWPIRETKRKEIRTFINQLNNMDRYPEYVYGASQPQQFSWLEELSPELFDRLKEAEKNGKLELQGGFWVESDTNLPSGESLIRQAVYGQKYWKEKFGHICKTCWLPDTFGFSGNLPQIMKKSGMDYFLTMKLTWSDTNKVPYHTFRWKGVDGSEVIAHIPPEHTYSGEAMPINTVPAMKAYGERDKVPVWASLFGMGDGGAGPSVGHIESYIRQQDSAVLPKVIFSPIVTMFEKMEEYRDNMPSHQGELYLEFHRGTYTTQSDIKKHNYLTEYALHNAEFLAALSGRFDKKKVDEIWKEFLLYQFHDILPGTSVERVYKECFVRHEIIRKELNDFVNKRLDEFHGSDFVAYNFNPYGGKEIVEYNGRLFETDAVPYGGSKLLPYDKETLSGGIDFLQNEYLTVRLDKNGEIVSIARDGKEYVEGYAGRIKLFSDITAKYDAWEIDYSYLTSPSQIVVFSDPKVTKAPGYICHETTGKASASTFTRRIVLRAGKPYVEVELDVDWKEEHKMLRAETTPKEWADEVLCNIQMSTIKRSTSEDNLRDKAKFEICAQKWVDVGGISFMAQAKYGWRVKNGLVSLNLLRAPTGPDPTCDRRKHTLRFAYYPHEGTAFDAETPRYANVYGNPLVVRENASLLSSFITTDKRNVIVETIKPAEDGNGIVLRIYEAEGKETKASIKVSKQFKKASETNMLEDEIGDIDLNAVVFTPFEIKTVRLFF